MPWLPIYRVNETGINTRSEQRLAETGVIHEAVRKAKEPGEDSLHTTALVPAFDFRSIGQSGEWAGGCTVQLRHDNRPFFEQVFDLMEHADNT